MRMPVLTGCDEHKCGVLVPLDSPQECSGKAVNKWQLRNMYLKSESKDRCSLTQQMQLDVNLEEIR